MAERLIAGCIVKGHFWPEPVEIKLLEEAGKYVHIVGATTISGKHIDQIIPRDEFHRLSLQSEGFKIDQTEVLLSVTGMVVPVALAISLPSWLVTVISETPTLRPLLITRHSAISSSPTEGALM